MRALGGEGELTLHSQQPWAIRLGTNLATPSTPTLSSHSGETWYGLVAVQPTFEPPSPWLIAAESFKRWAIDTLVPSLVGREGGTNWGGGGALIGLQDRERGVLHYDSIPLSNDLFNQCLYKHKR